jgi:hypothetical protein
LHTLVLNEVVDPPSHFSIKKIAWKMLGYFFLFKKFYFFMKFNPKSLFADEGWLHHGMYNGKRYRA